MPRQNVTCIKPSDPPFIRRMKERVGYVEPPSVDTKREVLPCDAHENRGREDEKPVVVVLKPGDLTAEEADAIRKRDADEAPADGRIVFKKPTKRKDEEEHSISASSSKKLREKDKKNRDMVVSVKDSRLLSFGEDEEAEEDD